MFCYIVLPLLGMLAWGAWDLLLDVFVSFPSRSKLFSGDVLEVSQVLHCSPWAVRRTSEHRQRSGKKCDEHRTVSHKGLLFSSNCHLLQFYDTTGPVQWLFATKSSLISTPMVLQRKALKDTAVSSGICWSFFLSQFRWLTGCIWFLPKGKTAFC